MIPGYLYDLAFQFRETRLWMELEDSDIFAVKFSGGEIGYCCVMGMAGAYRAFVVYVGARGWDSYRRLSKMHTRRSALSADEIIKMQDCLHCSFGDKNSLLPEELKNLRKYARQHDISLKGKEDYPNFERFKPGYYPWRMDDEADQGHIAEALSAALEVARRLKTESPRKLKFRKPRENAAVPLLERTEEGYTWGSAQLPPPPAIEYPFPRVESEVMAARLRQLPKAGTWECGLIDLPKAVQSGGELSVPYFPSLLLIVARETETALSLGLDTKAPYDAVPDHFLNQLAVELLKGELLPEVMAPADERTAAFLKGLCAQAGVALTPLETPLFDEVRESLLNHLDEQSRNGKEGTYAITQEMLENLSEGLDDVLDLFESMGPSGARMLPKEMIQAVEMLSELEELPDAERAKADKILGYIRDAKPKKGNRRKK